MTQNDFTRRDSNQLTTQTGFLKFNSSRLMTRKAFRIFWFKSTHDSKKLPKILIWIYSWLKTLEYWFDSSHDPLIRINCWFRWPFLGFQSSSLTFLGFQSVHDSISISKTWIDSTHGSSGSPGIDSVGSPGIFSDWLMTQSPSPFFI